MMPSAHDEPPITPDTAFPLDEAVTAFWRWRADHLGNLGRYHAAAGDPIRAMDCLVRQLTLRNRLGDDARRLDAILDLLEVGARSDRRDGAVELLDSALDMLQGGVLDPRRLLAQLDTLITGLSSADTSRILERARALASPETEESALLSLAVARHYRSGGDPARSLELLAGPLAWAERTGFVEAEVALRSEAAACHLDSGAHPAAVAALERNVARLDRARLGASALGLQARDNLDAARRAAGSAQRDRTP